MDLSAQIKNLKIDPAVTNVSGILSQPQIIKRISNYDIGAFFTKSTGIEPREGFLEPVVYHDGKITLNAFGLANPGYKITREELEEIYPLNKPLIASIFGENEEEFIEIATGLEDYCDGFKLNVSCPNIKEGEKSGITIGRDPELVKKYTKAVKEHVKKPVIVKLTPNVPNIETIAKAAEDGGADAISAINTVAPATVIDAHSGKHVLTNKYGGLSGPSIKPIGIAAVRKIYNTVKIPVIGMGGAKTFQDAIEYYRAGASVVGFGTVMAYKKTKNVGKFFENLKSDLERILEEMGVSSLKEIIGIENG